MTQHAQFRRMGWIVLLALAAGLAFALNMKVQAVHSEVVRAERRIVALEQEKLLLATEFETLASQAQLAAWNRVDFGYTAPGGSQFLVREEQLAALGASALPGVGSPIQLARVDKENAGVAKRVLASGSITPEAESEIILASARLDTTPTVRVPLAALATPAAE